MNKLHYPLNNWRIWFTLILLVNFIIRLLIFNNTNLFSFSDYQSYFGAIDFINDKGHINLLGGNSLFAISYLGYFSKYILGNLDYFFWFNCILGTLTTFLVSYLAIKVTGKPFAGLTTAMILTVYTEFMIFSSVFYTPVIMLFLLSLFILLIFYYFQSDTSFTGILYLVFILAVYLVTYLFKPELVFLPFFIAVLVFITIRQRKIVRKSLFLTIIFFTGILLVKLSGIYTKTDNEAIANDFVFFGHTDYGGDGGEGAFIYPENRARYDEAWQDYRIRNNLNEPTIGDRNRFQILEIKRFIFQHPFKWTELQFTKFFRTFGVVPESTSFKILYTGLLKGNLWLTSIIVVAPVALIILLFIIFFNFPALRQLYNASTQQPATSNQQPNSNKSGFLFIYLILFIYYILATIFFGQYQERYRLPVMVVFIIPMLGYFIAAFDHKNFLNKGSLIIKGLVIVLFLIVWIFQAKKAIRNEERLENAIESVTNNR
jgi:hypothetical protein